MQANILFDTNVWVDYFIDRGPMHDAVFTLVSQALASEAVTLCTAVTSTNDIYYAIQQELKREIRAEKGVLPEGDALAAREMAWACLQSVRKLSFIVPADESTMMEATIVKEIHFDYEDDLVIAAAKRVKAECIVTSDEQMLKHQPYKCITPQEAIEALESEEIARLIRQGREDIAAGRYIEGVDEVKKHLHKLWGRDD